MTNDAKKALDVLSKCDQVDRNEILYRLRENWWGENRVIIQDDILDRYDHEEYWDPEITHRTGFVGD